MDRWEADDEVTERMGTGWRNRVETENSPRRSDAILGQRKEEPSLDPNEKLDLRPADQNTDSAAASNADHGMELGTSGRNPARQQVFADEPVLEVPLVDPKQIVDFAYFAPPHWGLIRLENELEVFFESDRKEPGCELGIHPTRVWIGYKRSDRISSRRERQFAFLPWWHLMRVREAGQVIRDYFVQHCWKCNHLKEPVSKRGFDEMARVLHDEKLFDAKMREYNNIGKGENLVQSGENDAEDPSPATKEKDDLKEASQIEGLEFWQTDKIMLRNIDKVTKKIADNKINVSHIWVKYKAVDEEDPPNLKDYWTPCIGLFADRKEEILLSYMEVVASISKSKLELKACQEIKKCMENPSLLSELIALHREKYYTV